MCVFLRSCSNLDSFLRYQHHIHAGAARKRELARKVQRCTALQTAHAHAAARSASCGMPGLKAPPAPAPEERPHLEAGGGEPLFDRYADCKAIQSGSGSGLTADTFMEEYAAANKPVVVKGMNSLASLWHAAVESLQADRKSSNHIVKVAFTAEPGGNLNSYRSSSTAPDLLRTLERLSGKDALELDADATLDRVLIRPTKVSMYLADYFTLLANAHTLLPAGLFPYLSQYDVWQLFVPSPASSHDASRTPSSVLPEMEMPRIPRPPAFAERLGDAKQNLWLSPPGLRVDSHFDVQENLILQLNGTKDVLLFPPTAYTDLEFASKRHVLQPKSNVDAESILTKRFGLVEEWADGAEKKKALVDSAPFSGYRLLQSQRPPFDYLDSSGRSPATPSHFSEWAAKHACRAVLEPGDMLFIPTFWLHAVHGFGDNIGTEHGHSSSARDGGAVMSVNMWFKSMMTLDSAIAKYKQG